MALSKALLSLLATIALAGENGVEYPTKEVSKLIDAGVVEFSDEVDGVTTVRINDEGRKLLPQADSATAVVAGTERAPTIKLSELKTAVASAEIPLPGNVREKSVGDDLPFDSLEVGKSFFIPAPEGVTPKTLATRISTVSSFVNKKYSEVVEGEFQTVERTVFTLDENGKRIKGEDGAYLRELDENGEVKTTTEQVPVRRQLREFQHRRIEAGQHIVDGTPWGFPGVEGVAVWRVL